MLDSADTIAAIASPAGCGLRGIVRACGPRTFELAGGLLLDATLDPAVSRPMVVQGAVRVTALGRALPALLSLWPGPRTYTGQDQLEIHTVGSPPVLQGVLSECLRLGARLARRGEFTLRAFLGGRLDLTQAEAVLAVIDAQSPAQFERALGQLAGGLGGNIREQRSRLLDILAHIEAGLDFVEEADVDPIGRAMLAAQLVSSGRTIAETAGRLSSREREHGLPRVALIGPPNAGKSRLFNAITGVDHAIVSPHAGTTRDYLSARVRCSGVWIELIDTAGSEIDHDPIGRLAQAARAEITQAADLWLYCEPAGADMASAHPPDPRRLVVYTKSDLQEAPLGCLATSSLTGAGLDELRRSIARRLDDRADEDPEVVGTSARCRAGLIRAAGRLTDAAVTLEQGGGDELVALDLRDAIEELGRIVGLAVADDVLDRIFERFCIGK